MRCAVSFLLDPNPTNEARQGVILIAGQRFIVNQDAGPASSNRFPIALDDSATTNQGAPVNIAVLANDSDPDGDAVAISSVSAASHGSVAANADGTLRYAPISSFVGTDSFTYTISDGRGGIATAAVTIRVSDTEPPTVTCSVNLNQMWPPNHDLVNIGLTASAFDNQDGTRPVEVLVFSDEDDQEPTGDGTHSPDAKDIASGTLRLRSERKGDADGRVYLIVLRAVDSAGNVGVCCKTVVVPRSRSANDVASVESQAAAARAFCLAHGGAPPAGYFRVGDGPFIGPIQ